MSALGRVTHNLLESRLLRERVADELEDAASVGRRAAHGLVEVRGGSA